VKDRSVVNVSAITDQDTRVVQDILFVPDLRTNLVSVAKIIDKRHVVIFYYNQECVTDQSRKVRLANRKRDLFYVREGVEYARAEIDSTWNKLLK